MTDIRIDFSDSGNSSDYTGSGWSAPENNGRWTVDHRCELRLTGFDPTRSYRCEVLVGPFVVAPALTLQRLHVFCAGIPLLSTHLTTGAFISFVLPRAAISPTGSVTLVLVLPDACTPISLGSSNDPRRLGVSVSTAVFQPLDEDGTEHAPHATMPAPAILPAFTAAAALGNPDTGKAPVAAVTMVYNEPEYLPIWLRHYAKHVGIENCYVIDHGSTDGSTSGLKDCTVVRIPRSPYDPVKQSAFNSRFCSGLLCWYDRVLYSDVDELVLPDPRYARTLREYTQRPLPDVLNVIGLNVVHRPDREPPLDLTRPVTLQRPYVLACSPMCKPLLIARDVVWAGGSHSADAVVAFDHLYCFHLRWFDLPIGLKRIARTRAMAWAQPDAGGHSRVADTEFESGLNRFASLPLVDNCEFAPTAEPLAPFLDAVLRSQAGREFSNYKIDLGIWWEQLWRIPERFIGTF